MKTKIPKETLLKMRIEIGGNLRQLREHALLNQEEFSAISGLSRATVSKVENGRFSFSVDIISLYMSVLGNKAIFK